MYSMDAEFIRVDLEVVWGGKVRITVRVISILDGLKKAREKAIWRKTTNKGIDHLIDQVMGRSSTCTISKKYILREMNDIHRAALLPLVSNTIPLNAADDRVVFRLWDLRNIVLSGNAQLSQCYRENHLPKLLFKYPNITN